MQYRLIELAVDGPTTLALTWQDGRSARIDFADNIDRGGVCAPLANPEFFATAHLVDDGFAVGWSDAIEFSADSLRYRAFPDDYTRDYASTAAE